MLLEQSLFWRIGGFNESMRANEDAELCARAWRAGAKVLASASLAVLHYGAERDLKHFARRQYWHGSGVINRPAFKANLRAIALAANTLGCSLCALISAFLGRFDLLILFLAVLLFPAVWLALTGPQRKRRLRDAPLLALLVLTYSFARASVLPLAVVRGVNGWSRRAECKVST
jgi:GT2 family glycosyltransferase